MVKTYWNIEGIVKEEQKKSQASLLDFYYLCGFSSYSAKVLI